MRSLVIAGTLTALCSADADIASAQDTDANSEADQATVTFGPDFVAPLEGSDDLEVIISEVSMPPSSSLPSHFHPGQDFVFVIEGEVLHAEEGREDRVYRAGEVFVVQRDVVHSESTLDQSVRAVVFHVHPKGAPIRELVE